MPTYIYKCVKCDAKYEVFTKSPNFDESVMCPDCGSEKQKRVMTSATIATFTEKKECGCATSEEPRICMCGAN